MHKFTISVLIGVALLIGCAAIIGRDEPPHAATPVLTFDQDADSVRLRGTWSAVLDARGNAVPTYAWTLRRSGAAVDSGTVSSTTVLRTFANPLPGDSAVYVLTVVAIDVRNVRGAPGTSPALVVRSPWTAPPAPVVGLDTLATAPPSDDYEIMAVFIQEDGSIVELPRFSRIGQEAQGCVVEWIGGVPRLGAGQSPACDPIARALGQQPVHPGSRAI